MGLGLKNNDFFQEPRYRVQHELSDPSGGYIEGSEDRFQHGDQNTPADED